MDDPCAFQPQSFIEIVHARASDEKVQEACIVVIEYSTDVNCLKSVYVAAVADMQNHTRTYFFN
jgi:hypothetical protein